MDKPSRMLKTREIAIVAVFSAVIVATNFALTDLINVKLMDTLVFVAAFVYGFRIGALVGVTSELVWGAVSPFGFGGYIIPFLVLGELLYAAAGSLAAGFWRGSVSSFSTSNLAIGSIMTICAFMWDIETNLGTAFIAYWPNLTVEKIIWTEGFGAGFMILHEVSDFMMGMILAPLVIVYLIGLRSPGVKPESREILVEAR
jgi:hypothetical protein